MKKLGFLYDISRCLGCGACQAACKEKNGLPTGEYFRRVTTLEFPPARPESEEGPEAETLRSFGLSGRRTRVHFSMACNHCGEPACVSVCPTGAMYKAKDGTVLHDDLLCVGCGRCVHACPYGAPSLSGVTGYSQKCDACHDRRAEGRQPACVEACRTRALMFGPLEDTAEALGGKPVGQLGFLPDDGLTKPSLDIRRNTAIPEDSPYDPALVDIARESDLLPYMGELSGSIRTVDVSESRFNEAASNCYGKSAESRVQKYMVLGGGAAGVSAALAIRECDADAEITIVCDEIRLPYSRPMLSKGSYSSFMDDRYPIISERELEEKRIRLMLRTKVEALDTDKKEVTLRAVTRTDMEGAIRTESYDKCIYALGMECFVPPIKGKNRPGVFTLRTERDLKDMRLAMAGARSAVIIGGGITGIEAGWEMKRAGLEVTVLEAAPQLLGRILDEQSAGLIHKQLLDAGLTVIIGTGRLEILGEDETVVSRATAVETESGASIPADLVLISTGYKCVTDIAAAAGIETDRGVSVNEYLETSAPDVWACGDSVALGLSNWMHSLVQGKIAGLNAAGRKEKYLEIPEPALAHTAGTSMLSVGNMGKDPGKTYEFLRATKPASPGLFRVNPRTPAREKTELVICVESGTVCGITLIGDIGDMAFVEETVRERRDIRTFRDELERKGVTFA